jgi:hypothetical protein
MVDWDAGPGHRGRARNTATCRGSTTARLSGRLGPLNLLHVGPIQGRLLAAPSIPRRAKVTLAGRNARR